jgi:hypothetical protein
MKTCSSIEGLMKHLLSRIILSIAVAMLAHTACAESAGPSSQAKQGGRSPVKVFILAGQSNMEGQAVVDIDWKSGDTMSAGVNRHGVEDERALRGRQ